MATERESTQLNKLREQNDLAPLLTGFHGLDSNQL
jgi:hypothetical protein